MITWQEWLDSRETKRAALRKYGVDAPSRRRTSFNSSERFMRQAFGGARIPQFAQARASARAAFAASSVPDLTSFASKNEISSGAIPGCHVPEF